MHIRFTPEAEAELAEARQWYSHQRQDLDLEFMQCIDDALSRIVNNPRLFPLVYRISDVLWFIDFLSQCFMKSWLMRLRYLPFSIRDVILRRGNHGCQIENWWSQDRHGIINNAFVYACMHGHIDAAELLLETRLGRGGEPPPKVRSGPFFAWR